MSWTNIFIGLFLTIHVVVCLLMVIVILMQRSKQEGLGAAFGGGITDSMFGAQTSQVLVKATVWLAILFFGLTIVLARLYAHRNKDENALQKALMSAPAAPISVSPGAPATATASATPAPVEKTATASATVQSPQPAKPALATPAKK